MCHLCIEMIREIDANRDVINIDEDVATWIIDMALESGMQPISLILAVFAPIADEYLGHRTSPAEEASWPRCPSQSVDSRIDARLVVRGALNGG